MIVLWLLSCAGCGDRFQSRADERYPAPPRPFDGPQVLEVPDDEADGTLTNGRLRTDGVDDTNRAGGGDRIVVRFDSAGAGDAAAGGAAAGGATAGGAPPGGAPGGAGEGAAGPPVAAHLVLPVIPAAGLGPLHLRIRALPDPASPEVVSQAAVDWKVPAPWPDPYAGVAKLEQKAPLTCAPFLRRTPDLAPLFAELGPDWATRPLGFSIEAVEGELAVQDSVEEDGDECPGRLAPRLELARSVRATLAGKELLSRPTDRSVTLSVHPRVPLELQAEWWSDQSDPAATSATELRTFPGDTPAVLELTDLQPDTTYTVRLRYRLPGAGALEVGPERTFHTRRAPGQPFTFTVSADVHLLNMEHRRAYSSMHLLKSTMERAATERPDFHLDLGDSFNGESYRSFDASDPEEMQRRLLSVREYFELVQAPVLTVLGNHEGEQGWRIADGDPLPEVSARFRRVLFPNPVPSESATGNRRTELQGGGFTENYYAFTWGDVLFVVLDPYRYTPVKPHRIDKTRGSGDRWDWTLGKPQYDWLVHVLESSDAPFKLVFSHQVTGGTNDYGRGGRLAATSFEWGAPPEELAEHRPGWARSVHRVLADTGVTAFLHGHDHVFAFEAPLDGVGYVTVPQPGDAQYDQGHGPRSEIQEGATVVENAGYLRFRAGPQSLVLEYVRSFLPGDGEDGQVAFRYEFTDCDGNRVSDLIDVARGRPDADQDGRPDDCR